MPCAGECDPGCVLNSEDVCVPVECAPTVASGNEGCGGQNLNLPEDWCQPGVYNPFTHTRFS